MSELIAESHPTVCVPRSLVGGAGGVPAKHLWRPPSHETHEIGLGSTVGSPPVGSGVTELVGVKVRDADRTPSALQHLHDPTR